MTLHTDRPNKIMSLPTVQISTELAVLLAYYLSYEEKDRGYSGLMRRAADHQIYERVSRWRTASDPEATTRPTPWSENFCLALTARTWPRPWAGRWETSKTS